MNKNVLLLAVILFATGCSILKSKPTTIIVLGAHKSEVTAYNGNEFLFSDIMTKSSSTDFSKSYSLHYKFRDSLFVTINRNGDLLKKRVRIKRSKYIYIDNRGANFRIFGTNKKVPLI